MSFRNDSLSAPPVSPVSGLRRQEGEPLRLLVSVRDAEEAAIALASGVDVIDVKEPARGALGRADDETLQAAAKAIGGRAVSSLACGEAVDRTERRDAAAAPRERIADGYAFFKHGPAKLATRSDWREILIDAWSAAPGGAAPIAVAYADFVDAQAPAPEAIAELAIEFGCAGLLFDTSGKSPRLGLTALPEARLFACIAEARKAGLLVSLAGSLGACDVADVARLGADLIAVRGAACAGGRDSRIDADRIASLKSAILQEVETRRDFDAKRSGAAAGSRAALGESAR